MIGGNVVMGEGWGKILVTLGIIVKLAGAPMHMWVPDVYEGAIIMVVGMLSTLGKLGMLMALLHVGPVIEILGVSGVMSIVYGGVGALNQTKVKRLLAYIGVSHVGYVLLGLSVQTEEGMMGVIVYLWVYVMMMVGVITVVRVHGREGVRDYVGLWVENRVLSLTMGVLWLSLAGMPPLLGFVGKWWVIVSLVGGGY